MRVENTDLYIARLHRAVRRGEMKNSVSLRSAGGMVSYENTAYQESHYVQRGQRGKYFDLNIFNLEIFRLSEMFSITETWVIPGENGGKLFISCSKQLCHDSLHN